MTITEPDIALQPASFDTYVGQAGTIERLKVAVASAKKRVAPLDHLLLYGPPGTGKTTLARTVAAELGDPLAELTQPSKLDKVLDALYDIKGAGILFVDEVHAWSRKESEALYTLMEDGFIEARWGREDFPWLTLIGATTEKHELPGPLFDRFTIKGRLEAYTADEMERIVAHMAAAAGVPLVESTITAIATAAAGVPRIARSIVFGARDLHDAEVELTPERILSHCQISPDGLNIEHLDYLKMLASSPGGRASSDLLSTRLQIHPRQLKQIERMLHDKRFIVLTPQGRHITAAGRARHNDETQPENPLAQQRGT